MHVKDCLADTLKSTVLELDDHTSITRVIASGADTALVIDSTFGNGDKSLPIELRELLNDAGVKLIGASKDAFILARDKLQSKKRFSQSGVNTPKTLHYGKLSELPFEQFNFPVIAKPNFGASSINVHLVDDSSSLGALCMAHKDADDWLVEEFISGREFTVAVLTTAKETRVLPPAEIEMTDSVFYDFKTKNETLSNNLFLPARLSSDQVAELNTVVKTALLKFPLMAVCRFDVMLRQGIWYVLEVNSEPLLSNDDFVARCARVDGLSYEGLLQIILGMTV